MKKKIICLCAISVCAGWLFGCGAAQTEEIAEPETEISDSSDSGSDKQDEPTVPEPEPEQSPAPEPDTIKREVETYVPTEFLLDPGTYSSTFFYVIDADGNRIARYERDDLRAILDEQSLFSESASMDLSPFAVCDGILYFNDYTAGPDGEWRYYVYAMDPEQKQAAVIWTQSGSVVIDHLSVYGRDIMIDSTDDGKWTEDRYIREGDSLKFTSESFPYEDFAYSVWIGGYEPVTYNFKSGMSITECLDRYGQALVRDGSHYGMLDTTGSVSWIDELNLDSGYIDSYDGRYVFFTEYDSDNTAYNSNRICCLDTQTDHVSTVIGFGNSSSILQYSDGTLYYYVNDDGDSYGLNQFRFYAYDPEKDESEMLFEDGVKPGMGNLLYAVDTTRIAGQDIYHMIVEDYTLEWARMESTGDTAEFKTIDCPINEINALKYGKVTSTSGEDKCRFCGIPLNQYYVETFILDPKYSEHADEINAVLNSLYEESITACMGDYSEDPADDSECSEHKEYPSMYCQQNEDRITDVTMMGTHYMAVDISGYWYGGGAHGYPSRNQLIFDLNTGAEMKLKDFYTGTEEEFKELCARKTKEDFESEDTDEYTYFATEAQEVYDQAYGEASIETSIVEFREDGAYLLYQPYDMGPYSSGYIEVLLPYEELLGHGLD